MKIITLLNEIDRLKAEGKITDEFEILVAADNEQDYDRTTNISIKRDSKNSILLVDTNNSTFKGWKNL